MLALRLLSLRNCFFVCSHVTLQVSFLIIYPTNRVFLNSSPPPPARALSTPRTETLRTAHYPKLRMALWLRLENEAASPGSVQFSKFPFLESKAGRGGE